MRMSEQDDDPIYERINPALIDSNQPIGETVINRSSTVLGGYHARNYVSDRQAAAGFKLQEDWYYGGMEPSVTSSYSDIVLTSGRTPCGLSASEQMAHHKRQYQRALDAVGHRLKKILEHVVCKNQPAGELTPLRGRTAQTGGMYLLRLALDTLADHYKLAEGVNHD